MVVTANTNKKLNKARNKKDDEFYTRYEDIEKELKHYKKYLKGKTIYCNCDSTESNFFKYFYKNFKNLGLKRLIISWYVPGIKSLFKKSSYSHGKYIDITAKTFPNYNIKDLDGDGDFRSQESISLLKQADIIVTNPPFSLLTDFIKLLINYKKQCIVVVPMTFFTTTTADKCLIYDIMRLSSSEQVNYFDNTDKTVRCYWLTTFPSRKKKPIRIVKERDFQKLDNYDAIEMGKCIVPENYYGKIAVPLNLPTYDYSGYKIVKAIGQPVLNGSTIFKRYIIQKK